MIHRSRSFGFRIALSTMLAASALSFGAAWAAEPDVETRSISVDLADIDIFSPAGRAEARDRITMAASRACNAMDVGDLVASQELGRCRETAILAAGNDLDLKIAMRRPTHDASAVVASR